MEVNNITKWKIVTKQWANAKDVMAITGFAKSKSYQIINEIQNQIVEEGKKNIARGVVPMNCLLKHLEISKTDIYKSALQEKNIFGLGGINWKN